MSTSEEEDSEIYEVESIIGHRERNGKTQYLLRWRLFDDDEATWEFEENMNCPELLAEYKAKQQSSQEPLLDSVYKMSPKLIVGAFKKSGKIIYRVACSRGKYISVEADVLREIHPELICAFLENKIKLNNNSTFIIN